MNHFKQAKEVMISWPKWKRDIADKTIGKSAMCEANSNAVLGDGWRDARIELPAKDGKYIVLCTSSVYEGGVSTTYYGNGNWGSAEVVAWMPLPDPPAFA